MLKLLWFGSKTKIKLVPDGKVVRRRCPECGRTTEFREAQAERSYSAYSVVKLWDSTATVYVCASCGEAMELEDTAAPELSAREREELRQIAAQEAKVAEKKRLLEDKRTEQARRDREAQIDVELEALKRRLSKE